MFPLQLDSEEPLIIESGIDPVEVAPSGLDRRVCIIEITATACDEERPEWDTTSWLRPG